jgi:hypothetical protein
MEQPTRTYSNTRHGTPSALRLLSVLFFFGGGGASLTASPTSPDALGAGADGTFNTESWLYAFSKASATRNGGALRALRYVAHMRHATRAHDTHERTTLIGRVDIIDDTVRCCEQLSYRLLTGEQIPITTAQALQEQVKAYVPSLCVVRVVCRASCVSCDSPHTL